MSDAPVVPGLATVALDAGSAERLADFCRLATDFFELVGGMPGGPETAADILEPLPAHITPGTVRRFGLERDGDLIGVLELLEGYPTPDIWYIGLLVLVPRERRSGLGSRIWAAVRDWIQARGGAQPVPLVVVTEQDLRHGQAGELGVGDFRRPSARGGRARATG